jgi:transglutaminase-like putative cysteine protease
MRRFILLSITLLGISNFALSQEPNHNFGRCSDEELQMRYYSKDSTAEAVVVYDIGKSYFKMKETGLELVYERSFKIKVFNKAGIDVAKFKIHFYEQNSKAESILEIEGNTYNYENGKIRCTRLDSKNTYEEDEGNNWKNLKFAMPDVKEGSVIEVRYKISSPYFFNFRSWCFQYKIPVIYSEYTTMMIPFYEYRFILQGISKLSETKKYKDSVTRQLAGYVWQDMVYVFIMKDVPAFKDESYISAPDDYKIQIKFQLTKYINSFDSKQGVINTWPKLIKELLDETRFGDFAKNSQKQALNIVDTMQLTSKSIKEKTEKIFNFVKNNFSWDGELSEYTSVNAKDFLQSKVGNSADINLFLLGMLNAAEIEAYPVLISTRGHGKIKYDYPFLHFFNYTIVAVPIDGQNILLDATEPLCVYGMLPTRCLNDVGLTIKKGDKVEWVKFSSTVFSSTTYSFDLKPDIKKDSILGNYKIFSAGYDGLNLRKKYLKGVADFKDEVIASNLILADSIKVENLNEIEKLFSIEFNAKSGISMVDGKILISPFCGYAITDNPLKQPTRSYPIDMTYKKRKVFMSTTHIPVGYKILSKPEGLTIDNNDIKITYITEMVNDSTVKFIAIYEFKRDVYEASTYLDLKKYFNTIIDKFNEKLILVKD